MQTIKSLTFLALSLSLIISSCKKDDDPVEEPHDDHNHDEEIITTLSLTFTDSAGVLPNYTAIFKDVDGVGGNEATQFDTIQLSSNSTYLVEIKLLNETESPAEDITDEVKAEDDEHIFCYTPSGVHVDIERTDSDGTYEVGLSSKWKTNATGSGSVKVVLKHQPNVKDGTCTSGETDIELDFVTVVN